MYIPHTSTPSSHMHLVMSFVYMHLGCRRMQNLVGQLQSEIDSIMGAFGSPFFSPFSSDLGRPLQMMDRLAPALMAPGGGNMMAMDVTEDEKQFTIQAEVPGFTKEDIKVCVSNWHLFIR